MSWNWRIVCSGKKEENFKTWGTSQAIGCWCSLSELNQETSWDGHVFLGNETPWRPLCITDTDAQTRLWCHAWYLLYVVTVLWCHAWYLLYVVTVQSLSSVRLLLTAWTAAYQASLSFIISRSLLKLIVSILSPSICHEVGDATQPSHPLPPSSPFAFNLFQHQGLFQWVGSSHQMAKVLELQF